MSILLAASGAWHLDWDALVAIATFLLAVATIVLALITKSVAGATRAEAESQNRPILLPVDVEGRTPIKLGPEGIRVAIRNGGKGPAFAIRARLDPGRVEPEDWSQGILEQGQVAELHFRSVEPELLERYELLLDYRDLADKEAATRITIGLIALPQGDQRELIRDYAFVAVHPQTKHFGI
jgi:hypothetical protein